MYLFPVRNRSEYATYVGDKNMKFEKGRSGFNRLYGRTDGFDSLLHESLKSLQTNDKV